MDPFSIFGAGSSLGPFGNAGPATSSNSTPFSFTTGSDVIGGSTPTQTIAPVLIVGALGAFALWLVLR